MPLSNEQKQLLLPEVSAMRLLEKSDYEIAEYLNAKTLSGPVDTKIALGKLLSWGRWPAIEAYSRKDLLSEPNPEIQQVIGLCMTVFRALVSLDNIYLQTQEEGQASSSFVSSLVTATLITEEQAENLLALGANRWSIAESKIGRSILHTEISEI